MCACRRVAGESLGSLLDGAGLPTHLITGVVDKTEEEGTMNDRSWTLVQPVRR